MKTLIQSIIIVMVRKLTPLEFKKMKNDFLKWYDKIIFDEMMLLKHDKYERLYDDNYAFEESTNEWFENYLKGLLKDDTPYLLEYFEEETNEILASPEVDKLTQENWKKAQKLKEAEGLCCIISKNLEANRDAIAMLAKETPILWIQPVEMKKGREVVKAAKIVIK